MKTFKKIIKATPLLILALIAFGSAVYAEGSEGRSLDKDDVVQISVDGSQEYQTGPVPVATSFTKSEDDSEDDSMDDDKDDNGLMVGQITSYEDRGDSDSKKERRDYIKTEIEERKAEREKIISERKSEIEKIKNDLENLAKKNSKISDDAIAVSKDVEDNGNKSIEAQAKIESRSKLKTFLFGTDYKNIGVIRSTLVTTQNQTDRLINAKTKTTDNAILAELDAQIAKLQAIQNKTTDFVNKNEKTFSLFGWAVKLFSKNVSPSTTPATPTAQ